MAYTDINSEDRLVQQTFAEHLEDMGSNRQEETKKLPNLPISPV